MIPSLQYSKDGLVENPRSPYQPSSDVHELQKLAWNDLKTGDDILNRPFNEFNGMSLIKRMELDQKDWLAWSPAPSDDPDETWMFTGTSAVTRNKIISTAAFLTQSIIYPNVFAQDDDSEEDEAAAFTMKTLIEYNCRRHGYEQSFLYAVISGLVNPVSYFKVDWCEAYQDVLEGTFDSYRRAKKLDTVLSGFQYALLPSDEVLLGNAYCFDIQKQPFVIQRRRISYNEAEAKYGHLSDFQHVRPGVTPVLNESDESFYDIQDELQDNLVSEVRMFYRGKDIEFPLVNNIYLGSPNTDYNPVKHRDNQNRPKYPFVKFGAEPIDAQRFFAYKSLAAKLANDKELVDRMRQNAVDASTYATFPSIVSMGAGKIGKQVFTPATVVELGRDAKISPLTGIANPQYSWTAAREAEQDINKTSQDPQLSGISGGGRKTARETVLLQQNAITNLGIMYQMIANELVRPIGELMIDDIIRYESVGTLEELMGGSLGMKYKSFVLNGKVRDGKRKNIIIRFTDAWAGKRMSAEEADEYQVGLREEAGDEREIFESNPAVWSRRQFYIVIEADQLKPKNDAFDRTIKIETYDRAVLNPLIAADPEKLGDITRDLLLAPAVGTDAAKYIPKDTMRALQGLIPSPLQRKGVTGRVVEAGAMGSSGLLT